VPPGARQPVVNRLIRRATGRAIQPLGGVVDLEDDHAFSRAEVKADHAPRRAEPDGLSEEHFHGQGLPAQPCSRKNRGAVNHSIRERAVSHPVQSGFHTAAVDFCPSQPIGLVSGLVLDPLVKTVTNSAYSERCCSCDNKAGCHASANYATNCSKARSNARCAQTTNCSRYRHSPY